LGGFNNFRGNPKGKVAMIKRYEMVEGPDDEEYRIIIKNDELIILSQILIFNFVEVTSLDIEIKLPKKFPTRGLICLKFKPMFNGNQKAFLTEKELHAICDVLGGFAQDTTNIQDSLEHSDWSEKEKAHHEKFGRQAFGLAQKVAGQVWPQLDIFGKEYKGGCV
jgi:hypothetical protein